MEAPRRLDSHSVSVAARDGVVLLREARGAASAPAHPPPPPPPHSARATPGTRAHACPGGARPAHSRDRAAGRPGQGSAGIGLQREIPELSAGRAVDGTAARASAAWSDGQWWQVDLGAPTSVGKVAIEWEAAYASTYKILTSIDGQSWTQRASVSLGSAVTKVTNFEPTTARYVRILGVNRATQYGISFWEVHVYGGAAPPARPADPAAPAVPVQPPAPATPASGSARRPRPQQRLRGHGASRSVLRFAIEPQPSGAFAAAWLRRAALGARTAQAARCMPPARQAARSRSAQLTGRMFDVRSIRA